MLARRTQTNEPARCATLLPALARAGRGGPLALIEVGASAGLTLLVDRYSYDFGGRVIRGSDPEAPVLRCAVRGPAPVPATVPDVAWRAGLDLNPLDVTSDDDMHWLSCLLWPGEGDREQRLAGAVAAARRDPPTVVRGDLTTDLPALAARAPAGATLVVYHSAVLAYVAAEDRARFAGHGPRAGGGVAVQRGARSRARPAAHRLPGGDVRARSRRPHAAGPRRRSRGLAELAGWRGQRASPPVTRRGLRSGARGHAVHGG